MTLFSTHTIRPSILFIAKLCIVSFLLLGAPTAFAACIYQGGTEVCPEDCQADGGQASCTQPTFGDWGNYALCGSMDGAASIFGLPNEEGAVVAAIDGRHEAILANREICGATQIEDTGWEAEFEENNSCWNNAPQYINGVVIRDIRHRSLTTPYRRRSNEDFCLDTVTSVIILRTGREITCPAGYVKRRVAPFDSTNEICVEAFYVAKHDNPQSCSAALDGNPCNAATGTKSQTEIDVVSSSPSNLSFNRYYSSKGQYKTGNDIGANWRHTYSGRLNPPASTLNSTNNNNAEASYLSRVYYTAQQACEGEGGAYVNEQCVVTSNGVVRDVLPIYTGDGAAIESNTDANDYIHKIVLPNGSHEVMVNTGANEWASAAPKSTTLSKQMIDGVEVWVYIKSNNAQHHYAIDSGLLIRKINSNGLSKTLSYNDQQQLVNVQDDFGRELVFDYDTEGRINSVASPSGLFAYTYDAENNLTSVTYPDGTSKSYQYNNTTFVNSLTDMVDEKGVNFAHWEYDAKGRATVSEHSGGVERTTFDYSLVDFNFSPRTVVVGALGDVRTIYLTSNGQNRVVSRIEGDRCATCIGGNIKNRAYDTEGRLNRTNDWKGQITEYVYNDQNQRIQRIDAAGTPEARTTQYEWHPTFNRISRVIAPDLTTEYTYDAQGRATRTVQTDTSAVAGQASTTTREVTMSYNAQNLIASVNGPRADVNDVTTYTYDTEGNVATITNALGHVTSITSYNANGQPLSIIDSNSIQTDLEYDLRQRLTNITQAVGTADAAETMYEYDPIGQLTQITAADGSTLQYQYDDAHRLIGMTDNRGNQISYTLDNAGNITDTQINDDLGQLTYTSQAQFDTLSQLKNQIGAENQTSTLNYDAMGNLVDATDPNIHTTEYQYDALDRLTKQIDPKLGETDFTYNDQDQLVSVTDPNGLITAYTKNGFGDTITQVSPDTGTTQYSYDAAGNLLSQTDARGTTLTYTYDALNRLVTVTTPTVSERITYTYDQNDATHGNGIGQLTRVQDDSGTTDYRYDARGNVIEQTHQYDGLSAELRVGYQYNLANRLLGMTHPNGDQVEYTRDGNGQITAVIYTALGQAPQIIADQITLNGLNQLTSLTLGNGLTQSHTYDLDGRLRQQQHATSRQYDYDLASNVASISDTTGTSHSFSYDELDRLDDQQTSGQQTQNNQYSYDATSNRLTQNGTTTQTNSYGNNNHHLTSVNGTAYSYDAMGNLTNNGNQQFSYTDHAEIKTVSENSQTVASYTYHANRLRTSKVVDGTRTYYLYDQNGQLIAEADDQGELTVQYIYLYGQPIAVIQAGESTTTNPGPSGDPIIVDNEDSAAISQTGSWNVSGAPNAYNTNSVYSNSPNTFSWTADLPQAGEYEVLVRWTSSWGSRTSAANYTFTHSNGTETQTVNQNEQGSEWVSLGLFNFSAGDATITLSNQNQNGFLSADAVQFIPQGGSVTNPDPDPQPSGDPVIVDNEDSTNISQTGSWPVSGAANPHNANSVYSTAISSTFSWVADLPQTGEYEVLVRWTSSWGSRTSVANYTFAHANGTESQTFNQNEQGSEWVSLGFFSFSAGDTTITLSNQDTRGFLSADAVQFIPQGGTTNPDPDPEPQPSGDPITLDNLDVSNTTRVGSWVNSGGANPYNNNSQYSYAGSTFSWTADLPESGEYQVQAWWTQYSNRTTQADYEINHATGSSTETVNQQSNGGQWIDLGTYSFDAGSNTITLSTTAGGTLSADAVRFTPQGDTGTGNDSSKVIHYIHTDHLGTPRWITNQDQTTIWTWDGEAFGNTAANQDPDNDGTDTIFNLRFPGQYQDDETGLYYNWHRYYDPSVGRYITSDPIGLAGGINTFGYALGNPLFYIDAYGLAVWGVTVGVGGGVNGMAGGVSLTIGLDSNGSLMLLTTPEFGAGTSGIGAFARAIGGSGNVDDLVGAGVSVSAGAGGFTGSATLPISENIGIDCNGVPQVTIDSGSPVYELGRGSPGLSVTAGSGLVLGRTEVLGNIGRWIGGAVYNITH